MTTISTLDKISTKIELAFGDHEVFTCWSIIHTNWNLSHSGIERCFNNESRIETALRLPVIVSIKKMPIKPTEVENNDIVSDSSDFDTIFNTNWERIYGVVYRIVGDPTEAEDLALESFLRLHQRPPKQGTNLAGWLYRVATNLAFNALRSRKRRKTYENASGKRILQESRSINPAKTIERSEARCRVQEVLSKMKTQPAKILILRHSGLSYAEIAAAVGVAAASVGTLLSRAEREFESLYLSRFGMDSW